MSEFNKRFKDLRMKNKISQMKLAEFLHVSQVAIAHWENGSREPTAETVEKIAKFFKVSPAYLMGWTVSDEKIGDIFYNSTEENTVKTQRVSDKRKTLDKKIDQFNDDGIQKMSDYADDIMKIPEYRKEDTFSQKLELNAAHERTDIEVTEEMKKYVDDIMKDDSEWE